MMKVRYIGKNEGISLTTGCEYVFLGCESEFIRIIDNTGEDYLYDPDKFMLLDEDGEEYKQNSD